MKTLVWDCETAPNQADVWSLWNVNVSLAQLRQSSRMICFAAKWHGEKRTVFRSEFHHTPEGMLDGLHPLLSQADAVVSYNGKSFDSKMANTLFALADLSPVAPYHEIDLLAVVKKKFRFPSYKLAYVADAFGVGQKASHEGHMLWRKCEEGDEKAWRTMRRYNIQDVRVTEALYDKILPWIDNHPNLNLYGGSGCVNCGSAHLTRQGSRKTATGSYPRFQCQTCGRWQAGTKRESGVEIKP